MEKYNIENISPDANNPMGGRGLFKRKIIKALTFLVSAFVIGWLFMKMFYL